MDLKAYADVFTPKGAKDEVWKVDVGGTDVTSRWKRLRSPAFVVAGVLLMALGAEQSPHWLAWTLMIVGTLVIVVAWLVGRSTRNALPASWGLAGVVIGGGLGTLYLSLGLPIAGLPLLTIGVQGLMTLVAHFEHLAEEDEHRNAYFIGGLSATIGGAVWIAVFLVLRMLVHWSIWITLVGVVAVAIGMIPLSSWAITELASEEHAVIRRRWIVAGVGAALITTATLLLVFVTHARWYYALLFVAVFGVLATTYAGRIEYPLVLVAIILVTHWASIDRVDDSSPDAHPAAAAVVAIGDSYISGEGATTFYEGTNVSGGQNFAGEDNECRRAPTAYSVLLSDQLDYGLVFEACSGAKTIEVTGCDADDYARAATNEELQKKCRWDSQLEQVAADRAGDDGTLRDVAAVLVSIGGNDAGFGTIGLTCVAPGDCSEFADLWLADLSYVGARVETVYEAIKQAFPNVPVIAIAYPNPLGDEVNQEGCPWVPLDPEKEQPFLNHFVVQLNETLATAAKRAHVYFFDGTSDAVVGWCQGEHGRPGESGLNFVGINTKEGDLLLRLQPTNWTHNSIHPNAAGHVDIFYALLNWSPAEGFPLLQDGLVEGAANPWPTDPPRDQGEPDPTYTIAGWGDSGFVYGDLSIEEACDNKTQADYVRVVRVPSKESGSEPGPDDDPDLAVFEYLEACNESDGIELRATGLPQPLEYVVTSDGTASYLDAGGRVVKVFFEVCPESGCLDPGGWVEDQAVIALAVGLVPVGFSFFGVWLIAITVAGWRASHNDRRGAEGLPRAPMAA